MTIQYGNQQIPVYADPTIEDKKLFKLIASLPNHYESIGDCVDDLKGMLNATEAEYVVCDDRDYRLQIAKGIINEHIAEAACGIFDSRNTAGDEMETLYCDNGMTIDICYGYNYFEVFGLTKKEFRDLEKYYYFRQKEVRG